MRSLQTTRVCVVDDDKREYTRLFDVLSQMGLGFVHVHGDRVEDLPPEPFPGLRVVFLDMQLGSSSDQAVAVPHTANVFKRVVSHESGPVLVVIWSKHTDWVASFRERLLEHVPQFHGRLIFAHMEKPLSARKIDAERLRTELTRVLGTLSPLKFLWAWERRVHDAASATTGALCQIAAGRAGLDPSDDDSTEAGKLLVALLDILRILVGAASGKRTAHDTAMRDLYETLDPLHLDRLQHMDSADLESATQLADDPSKVATEDEMASINSMLLVEPVTKSAIPLRPGDLYRVKGTRRKKIHGVELARLTDSVLQKPPKESGTVIASSCVPVFLEVSPACDFLQRKRPISKLIAGVLVPAKAEKSIKVRQGKAITQEGAFYRFPVLRIPGVPNESMVLVFCSQYFLSVPEDAQTIGLERLCRVREPILSDVRNWVSAQSARVGYVYL